MTSISNSYKNNKLVLKVAFVQ